MMEEVTPIQFHLSQNYPNPFRDKTAIKYCVAYKTRVLLTVYDAEGNEIEKLVDEEKNPGTYEVVFQSAVVPNAFGKLASGNFYYRLEAGDYISEKKMELIK